MPSLAQVLARAASRVPERVAVQFGSTAMTYAALDARVNQFAHELASRGLAKGDRLLLLSGNSDAFVVALYAGLRLGAIVVPVPRSAPGEIDHCVSDSGARLLLFGAELVDTVRAWQEARQSAAGIPVLALGDASGFEDVLAAAVGQSVEPVDVEVAEDDDALIIYTSGTTGRPKGPSSTSTESCGSASTRPSVLDCTRGADAARRPALSLRKSQHAPHRRHDVRRHPRHPALVRPRDGLRDHRARADYLLLRRADDVHVPAARRIDRDARPVELRVCMYGAAPMPATTAESLVAALPGASIIQACGQIEGGPGGILLQHDEVLARPSASGRTAIANTEVRVVDLDDNDVAPGGVGEMIMRGETMMKGYWGNPGATAETVRDGSVHTGDLASLDEDGYITLVDRLKDMIITGGRNVYSAEVESALAGHPAVGDIATVARPNEEYGESVAAVVTPRDGAVITLEELRAYGQQYVSSYKLPRELIIDEIPRNPSGKILQHQIRAKLNV